MTLPPAGWYPDPETRGWQRYWDGARWTEHWAPIFPPAPPQLHQRSWFARHKLLASLAATLAVLLFLGGIGSALETSFVDRATPEPGTAGTPQASPRDHQHADREKLKNDDSSSDEESSKSERPKTPPKPDPRPGVKRYAVVNVVDGDTVNVAYRGATTVRIIGIDTPESVSPNTADECYGSQASAAATRMLQGTRVELVFDPSQGRTDKFGRTLAYLRVPGKGDFGLAMIRGGFAAEYTYDTAYMNRSPYVAAERRAKAAGRGLWDKCGGPHMPLPQLAPHEPKRFGSTGNCAPGYQPCVPPYPPDVDCADVDGPISVTGGDPHGLDADDDGVACEPY